MTSLVEKLIQLEEQLTREGYSLVLLGLFKLAEGSGNWDLVISARSRQFDPESIDTVRHIAGKLARLLAKQEAVLIRSIVPLSPDEPFVKEVIQRFGQSESAVRISTVPVHQIFNAKIGNLAIDEAYIVTAADDVMHRSSGKTLFENYDDEGW